MLSRTNGGCYIKPLCSHAYFFSRNRRPYRGVNLPGFLRETRKRILIVSTINGSWHTLGRRPRTFVAFLLIGVGWGGIITFICTSSHIWCYVIVWGGVGWGNNVHLHFLTYMMLRYCMSSCSMWMRLPKSQDIPWCQTTSKRWWTNGSLDKV